MLFPEAAIAECGGCGEEIPWESYWRGRGIAISRKGARGLRTWMLHNECPACGRRQSVGLDGPRWHRALYRWVWQIRYPSHTPPPGF